MLVIGGGVIGSATAYSLACRGGVSTILLEQYELGHNRGSSCGESRIIRPTYVEPHLAALMPEAFASWRKLEADARAQGLLADTESLLRTTGGLDFGAAGTGGAMEAVLRSISAQGTPHERVALTEVASRFPPLAPPLEGVALASADHGVLMYDAVYNEQSGVLAASRCVATLQALAQQHGAQLRAHTRVEHIERTEFGVTVRTSSGVFRSRSVVMALGGWAASTGRAVPLVSPQPVVPLPLVPIEVTVAYWRVFNAGTEEADCLQKMPVFIVYGEPFDVYGLPSTERPGCVKVCWHGGTRLDIEQLDRRAASMPKSAPMCSSLHASDTARNPRTAMLSLERVVAPFLATFMHAPPDSGKDRLTADEWMQRLEHTETCVYTMTPDEDFILDVDGDIVRGAGFSGHGFKLAPVMGRILADLALQSLPDSNSSRAAVDFRALQASVRPFSVRRSSLAPHFTQDISRAGNSVGGAQPGILPFTGSWEAKSLASLAQCQTVSENRCNL